MAASVETIGAAPARVVHSVLSPTALLETVARAYPIERPVACELWRLGMNDTYLLRTRRQRFVLRVYQAGWRSPEDVDYELALLAHLAVRGVPVSAAVPGDDGMLRLPVMAPEGPRMAALFGFALGKPLRWDDAAQSRLAGRVLGHVHAAADDFDGPRGRLQLDAEYLIDRPLADMRSFFETRPRDWLYLQGLAERLRPRLTATARDGLDWGPCHGDFTAVHLLVHRETVTVLDFDLCGAGWRAYDLLPARWQARRHRSAALWDAFLHGYREARPLSDRDLASVPLFEALRHLWGLGLFTRELPVREAPGSTRGTSTTGWPPSAAGSWSTRREGARWPSDRGGAAGHVLDSVLRRRARGGAAGVRDRRPRELQPHAPRPERQLPRHRRRRALRRPGLRSAMALGRVHRVRAGPPRAPRRRGRLRSPADRGSRPQARCSGRGARGHEAARPVHVRRGLAAVVG